MTFTLIPRWKKEILTKSERSFVILGILHSNYLTKAYYWGAVTAVVKILLFFLDSVLTFSSLLRALVIALVLHVDYMAFFRVSPHHHQELTKVDDYVIRSFKWPIFLMMLRDSATVTSTQALTEALAVIVNVLITSYVFNMISVSLQRYAPVLMADSINS